MEATAAGKTATDLPPGSLHTIWPRPNVAAAPASKAVPVSKKESLQPADKGFAIDMGEDQTDDKYERF